MAYEVLARKWRPKQLADVIGQEHVTRTLQHAIESNRVAHAYLFVGPRGIGKTTLSRIFAKALNCEHGPTPTPCDQCDMCREIMAGNSLDVIEIDAASNNGVENIRDIREAVRFAPARGRFKIYIIDEVHMLSTGAFNALLKTLEEPPPHAKFILATTDVDKLPATIISRCQRFDLRRIPTALIVKALGDIAGKEGVHADADALLAIARGAEGGMRDALSAFDQIISFRGSEVTETDVLAIFGLVSRTQLESLATAILKGDMAAGLRIIDDLDQSGKDLRRLTVELMVHFRNLLVRQQLGADARTALDVTDEQMATLDEQARLVDAARLLRIAEHLTALENSIRYALSRRTLFETTFLRCCRAATAVSLDQVIRQLTDLQAALGGAPAPATPPPASPAPAGDRGQAPDPLSARPAPPPAMPPPASPAPAGVRGQAPDPLAARRMVVPAAPPPAAAPAPVGAREQAPGPLAARRMVVPAPPPAAAPASSPAAPASSPAAQPSPMAQAAVRQREIDKAVLGAPAVQKAVALFNGQIAGIEPPRKTETPAAPAADADAPSSDNPESIDPMEDEDSND